MRTKLVILLMIFLVSCGRESSREKDNTGSVLEIDLLPEPESGITKLSEIAENVEYIPLQTTDSSLL
ncbi:MAG TPA: 6-bladed beta-propeller, partial [Bacteroidales bacterium]|nr:6-bladed beta-propeller [Bacteroidales bacterium]